MSKLVLNPTNTDHLSFVLIDDEDRVIAVIIPKHNEDCLGLVTQAIMDEFTGTTEIIYDKIKMDDETYVTQVEIEVTMREEDDEDESIRNFELVRTAVYHS